MAHLYFTEKNTELMLAWSDWMSKLIIATGSEWSVYLEKTICNEYNIVVGSYMSH